MNDRFGKLFAVTLVLLTLVYGLFQARTLIEGPELSVKAPASGATLEGPVFTVRGTAKNITRLTVNGYAVATDPQGRFSVTFATPDGYGSLSVQAENRFGYRQEEFIEFVGRPTHPDTEVLTS